MPVALFAMPFAIRRAFVLCWGFVALHLWAGPAPDTVRAEVHALMDALQSSGCEINRNGNWHTAAEAAVHLMRKFQHMERKNYITTTEHFIEQGASASSLSGNAYLVRCPAAAPMESKTWLMHRLAALRKKA
jgi:Family of unknown function (DUF5329)